MMFTQRHSISLFVHKIMVWSRLLLRTKLWTRQHGEHICAWTPNSAVCSSSIHSYTQTITNSHAALALSIFKMERKLNMIRQMRVATSTHSKVKFDVIIFNLISRLYKSVAFEQMLTLLAGCLERGEFKQLPQF